MTESDLDFSHSSDEVNPAEVSDGQRSHEEIKAAVKSPAFRDQHGFPVDGN